jgi:hypothetical protein
MALASLGIAAAASPNLATTVLLTDYVNSTGARCLDGSPQRYWIQPSASTACVRDAACAGPAQMSTNVSRLCDYATRCTAVAHRLGARRTSARLPLRCTLSNATKWYIHFMGGGWCESLESCAARAYAPTCYIGSSDPACFAETPGDSLPGVNFSSVMDFTAIPSCLGARWCGGLMSNDSVHNPLAWDWNKVS